MVQISERSVGPDDVVVTIFPHSELWRLPAVGYHRVPERTWAKLDQNSPVSGLCTDMVDSCLVFICHCKSTGRTTMMHTPSMVDVQALVDQLDYVTNNTSVHAELIVLRGGIYSNARKHELSGDVLRCIDEDEVWADRFVHDMRVHAKKLSLPLTVTRPARCLDHGCILVDKKTGKITIPVPAQGFTTDKYPHLGLPESMTEAQFSQLKAKDKFYRIISTAHAISMQQFGFQFAYPCYLQYKGTGPLPLPPIPDFARTLLQQYVLHGSLPPDLVVPINEKLNVGISEELRGYVNQYPLREQGMFCEVCRKPAKQTCNSCRTAWYCCREHQTSGWKDHRAWCRTHRISGSFSSPSRRDSGDFQASPQLSSKLLAKLEAKLEAAAPEATREETVSHQQEIEVPVPHVSPQEVKAEVIEQPVTTAKVEEMEVTEQPVTVIATKAEDNVQKDNTQESNAREDDAREDNVQQDNIREDNAQQDNTREDSAQLDNTREDNAQQDKAQENNVQEDNAIAVKEEPISVTSTELESPLRPQKALPLRNSRLLLHQLRTKLSLVRTSDAGAVVHRNLKTVVRLLYSWKFYFCIASVAFAYIIRTYRQDLQFIYPLA